MILVFACLPAGLILVFVHLLVGLILVFVCGMLSGMTNMFTNPNYCYKGVCLGDGIHGVMGGHGEKLTSAPGAKNPFYYHRTTADYFYRVWNDIQQRLPWILSDPYGLKLPVEKQTVLIAGVAAWQVLPESEKEVYRALAEFHPHWTGYNLFMSEYLTTH